MADALPASKQCHINGHPLFGAIAVQASDDRWGVMTPVNGGHWAASAEVDDWADLAAPTPVDPPQPEPEPEPEAAAEPAEAEPEPAK
jgi:hypothetical protein